MVVPAKRERDPGRKSDQTLRLAVLSARPLLAVAAGFAFGPRFLPILTVPPGADLLLAEQGAREAPFRAACRSDRPGGYDLLRLGQGEISLTAVEIVHRGRLAPGLDYKLYLVPLSADHEVAPLPLRAEARLTATSIQSITSPSMVPPVWARERSRPSASGGRLSVSSSPLPRKTGIAHRTPAGFRAGEACWPAVCPVWFWGATGAAKAPRQTSSQTAS
ncbi:MAG: hypothetical protein AAF968_10740 [Pseudomonadota bacterium]